MGMVLQPQIEMKWNEMKWNEMKWNLLVHIPQIETNNYMAYHKKSHVCGGVYWKA